MLELGLRLSHGGLDSQRLHLGDAFDVTAENILDHGGHRLGPERIAIDLANAADIVVGSQLDEDEITPTPTGRRIADDKNLEIPDFHLNRSLP